jgi:hypothetical protein
MYTPRRRRMRYIYGIRYTTVHYGIRYRIPCRALDVSKVVCVRNVCEMCVKCVWNVGTVYAASTPGEPIMNARVEWEDAWSISTSSPLIPSSTLSSPLLPMQRVGTPPALSSTAAHHAYAPCSSRQA